MPKHFFYMVRNGRFLNMVRNGLRSWYEIANSWYEMVILGTKWQGYEMAMVRNGYGTK